MTAVLFQYIYDDLLPEGHLTVNMGELQKNRGVMENTFLEKLAVLIKYAYFGGSRTGVYDKEFHFYPCLLCVDLI